MKKNCENRKKILSYILIVSIIGIYVIFKLSSSYTFGNINNEAIEKIENGNLKITYELFGAKGDGVTNDIEAIRSAHDFANREYVEKGILYTVYACDSEDCSDKNYYMGATDNGGIDVITNVDWKNAHFTVDDYIDNNDDGINDIDTKQSIFNITSPLKIYSKINGGGLTYITYNSNVKNTLSNNKTINPNTTNLKELIDAFYDKQINKTTFYNNNASEIEKIYKESKWWIIIVTNNNEQYIRKGSNFNSSHKQNETIIIDSKTGELLTEIDWTYDDITDIKVYPIPNNRISIKNGNFTTYTNNIVYVTDDSGNAEIKAYSKRNLFINYTGNIEISNIHHYLDEERHPYNNEYQNNNNGNLYNGFLTINNAAFIKTKDIYLSAHTSTNNIGTYDLVIDYSVNIFLDNINHACNVYENGEKNYSECYDKNIVDSSKWGIMASNTSKNIFITNSTMNRIDAHRGVTNLYVSDTTIGRSIAFASLNLTGKGYFYGQNLKIDSSECVLKLRDDYGSSWNGTMVFDNINYIINEESKNPGIIYSNNEENWDFGYTTYFPSVYINNLNIDTTSRNANNITDITFIKLSNLYNNNTNTKTIDKSNERNLYHFKGNIYLNNLIATGNTFKLFNYSFLTSNGDTLSKDSYGGNNSVDIYLDDDVFIDDKLSAENNTKFNIVNTMNNESDVIKNFFTQLKEKNKMPDSTNLAISEIVLSSGVINEEINSDVTNYTATVNSDSVNIELKTLYSDSKLSWDSKTIDLNYGDNKVEFSVTNKDGEVKNYSITITRPYNSDPPIIVTYNITYNANGGTNAPAPETGNNITVSSIKPNKNGYTFISWNTNSDGSGTTYNPGDVYDGKPNATLYAKWQTNIYNITYSSNGGTISGLPEKATYDSIIEIQNPTKTVTIHGNPNGTDAFIGNDTYSVQEFLGWTSSTIDNTSAYYDNTPWTDGNIKVTATNFKNLTTVNGGTVGLIANWNPTYITLPEVVKEGYTCNWNTRADGSGDKYLSGGQYLPSSDSAATINLYAECINNSNSDDEIDSPPKTGDVLIIIAWLIGISSLGYSVYYLKNIKKINN